MASHSSSSFEPVGMFWENQRTDRSKGHNPVNKENRSFAEVVNEDLRKKVKEAYKGEDEKESEMPTMVWNSQNNVETERESFVVKVSEESSPVDYNWTENHLGLVKEEDKSGLKNFPVMESFDMGDTRYPYYQDDRDRRRKTTGPYHHSAAKEDRQKASFQSHHKNGKKNEAS
ncbi:hypothetical protein LWI29_016465 [Acer saccharum]|uniref:Uncharacterized protein n=1 Tax=Acer saccharum TaxID=4024 RepID=A0AA39RQI4_ACESA|nr:hypothetical protein LWI29_016465 [Acer saccharum]